MNRPSAKKSQLPARLDLAAAMLDPLADGDILEVGCGTGVLIRHLASIHDGIQILGIDRSAKMISSAKGRLDDLVMTGRVQLEQHLLEDEPLGKFPRVVAVDVNGFWLDPEPAFKSLDRWLEPDGVAVLIFSAPGREKLKEIEARIGACDWLPRRKLEVVRRSRRGDEFVAVEVQGMSA